MSDGKGGIYFSSSGSFSPSARATGAVLHLDRFGTLSRVAERLLELAERFGTEEEGCLRIELRLSQDELAGWTGASIESVGRALATMRSLNWIETGRREIRVLDIEAVRRAAS